MKVLEELTREIREKLPRLKELSDGTIIKSLFDDKRNFITKDAFYQIGYSEDCVCLTDNVNINIDGYSYKTSSFEIIGKDPMLNDVIQYLWILVDEECDNSDDIIFAIAQLTSVFDNNCWNFNKHFLKDQSPELITFLHGLINQ